MTEPARDTEAILAELRALRQDVSSLRAELREARKRGRKRAKTVARRAGAAVVHVPTDIERAKARRIMRGEK